MLEKLSKPISNNVEWLKTKVKKHLVSQRLCALMSSKESFSCGTKFDHNITMIINILLTVSFYGYKVANWEPFSMWSNWDLRLKIDDGWKEKKIIVVRNFGSRVKEHENVLNFLNIPFSEITSDKHIQDEFFVVIEQMLLFYENQSRRTVIIDRTFMVVLWRFFDNMKRIEISKKRLFLLLINVIMKTDEIRNLIKNINIQEFDLFKLNNKKDILNYVEDVLTELNRKNIIGDVWFLYMEFLEIVRPLLVRKIKSIKDLVQILVVLRVSDSNNDPLINLIREINFNDTEIDLNSILDVISNLKHRDIINEFLNKINWIELKDIVYKKSDNNLWSFRSCNVLANKLSSYIEQFRWEMWLYDHLLEIFSKINRNSYFDNIKNKDRFIDWIFKMLRLSLRYDDVRLFKKIFSATHIYITHKTSLYPIFEIMKSLGKDELLIYAINKSGHAFDDIKPKKSQNKE